MQGLRSAITANLDMACRAKNILTHYAPIDGEVPISSQSKELPSAIYSRADPGVKGLFDS